MIVMDDIKNYYEVFTEAWVYFKKNYEHFDGEQALADFQAFDNKFKKNKYGPRVYDFAMRVIRRCEEEIKKNGDNLLTEDSLYKFGMDLMKIIFYECGEINEVRKTK